MGVESAEQSYEEIILGFLVEGRDDFCSGEALSDKLGLSRTAVWKHVEALRGKGYRIDALPARGYRLMDVPDKLTPLELAPLLSTHHLGQHIHFHESLPSTNVTAFQLAAEGAEHGEIVITEQQTAGKGRRGRAWSSPSGLNLYFSAILRPELPPQRASELTLVAAVALAEVLRAQGADARIKWPNDVQLEGRKVAGILTELSADPDQVKFVVLGVGVNLNAGAGDFPPELAGTATSLSLVLGRRVNRALFTSALWGRLEEWLDLHHEVGFEPVRQRWMEMSSTLGQEVRVRVDRTELQGVAESIDAAGALMVRTPGGSLERVLAGDVEQVRPR
jgi:BirA family transcriptional regulator, biotin operon repressor / biotin---[acetyl-CoA-carboxylase] ligase